jgi:hypothetical protein
VERHLRRSPIEVATSRAALTGASTRSHASARAPPGARGVYLFWGSGINSAGQITAYGVNFLAFQGVEGYLLTPRNCP